MKPDADIEMYKLDTGEEMMVEKELKLDTLRSIQVIDDRDDCYELAKIVRPFLKLKHQKRFQTRLSKAFEQLLTLDELAPANARSKKQLSRK